MEKRKKNVMYNSIHIEKITLNIGAGNNQENVSKGLMLLEAITGTKPIKTLSKHKILGWGIRPGLPIGCKVTVRGDNTKKLLATLFTGVDNTIKASYFDNQGNFSFGIKDYIEIDTVKYDPNIGMIGLEVSVSLRRKGQRVKNRSRAKTKIGKNHIIKSDESIKFIKDNFKVFIAGYDKEVDEDEE